jgi:steroid delta-isomerase-like uncharacterized protein
MTVEANKELVRRFYEELWNRGNLAAAEEFVAQDYVRHDLRPGDSPPGPAGQAAIAERFRAAFPDIRLDVEAVIAEGELVVARWTISGTHTGPWGKVAATDRPVSFAGVNFFRIAHSKIAEIWNVRDDLGLREQIGAPVYAGFSKDPVEADIADVTVARHVQSAVRCVAVESLSCADTYGPHTEMIPASGCCRLIG